MIIDLCKFDELLSYCGHKYISVQMGNPWFCGRSFENTIVSPCGIKGGFTVDSETEKVDVMIDFSGQYFADQTVVDQWRLLVGLKYAYAVNCLRIDLAVDDYTYSHIPLSNMMQSCEKGENFGFQKRAFSGSWKCGKRKKITQYFGSRESNKFVRVYDHEGECHRFEAEYKGKKAQRIFDLLSQVERGWFLDEDERIDVQEDERTYKDFIADILEPKDICANIENITKELHGCKDKFDIILQRIIGSIAVTAIDFRHETSRKDKSKGGYKDRKRCRYYQEFIDKVGSEIKLRVSSPKFSIEKNIEWLLHSCSKSVSRIYDALGIVEYTKWHHELIKVGRSKQVISDFKLVEYIRDNEGICYRST